MDRGAWWATVHRVAKSWTLRKRLSMHVQRNRERGISNMMQRGREATKEEDEASTLGAPKERYQQQRKRRY